MILKILIFITSYSLPCFEPYQESLITTCSNCLFLLSLQRTDKQISTKSIIVTLGTKLCCLLTFRHGRMVARYPWLYIVGCLIVTIACGLGLPYLQWENNIVKVKAKLQLSYFVQKRKVFH